MYVTLYFNNYNQSLNSANQVNDREQNNQSEFEANVAYQC